MKLIKTVLITAALASLGLATVTDGIGGLGLGANPAAPAIWKTDKRVDAGFTFLSNSEDNEPTSEDLLDITDNKVGEKSWKTKDELDLAPWVTYTGVFQDIWYQVGYAAENAVSKKTTEREYTALGYTDRKNVEKKTESLQTLSFSAAKDFNLPAIGGLTAGAKLDVISGSGKISGKEYDANGNFKSNSNSSQKHTISPYLQLGVGLAKDIDAKQKVLFAQTFGAVNDKVSTLKEVYKNGTKNGKAVVTEVAAQPETALGYVYTVSDALQLGAEYTRTWGVEYDRVTDITKHDDESGVSRQEVELLPGNAFGVAASYLPTSEIELQGSITIGKGGGRYTDDEDYSKDTETSLVFNALYTPSFANIGTVGIGLISESSKYDIDDEEYESRGLTGQFYYTYLF
ncbi:hypothetical protein NO2_1374 [Candidatus Termititenax persephonae]|uniref:Outer membrane protein n=1 Tax=Candidatus Termititenax persephonae TaxID=2218525 RepID=A0A388TI83_9BACT|nr:hypothetical protein NO2_1374 [Candidatus Termititenax persephonae]